MHNWCIQKVKNFLYLKWVSDRKQAHIAADWRVNCSTGKSSPYCLEAAHITLHYYYYYYCIVLQRSMKESSESNAIHRALRESRPSPLFERSSPVDRTLLRLVVCACVCFVPPLNQMRLSNVKISHWFSSRRGLYYLSCLICCATGHRLCQQCLGYGCVCVHVNCCVIETHTQFARLLCVHGKSKTNLQHVCPHRLALVIVLFFATIFNIAISTYYVRILGPTKRLIADIPC